MKPTYKTIYLGFKSHGSLFSEAFSVRQVVQIIRCFQSFYPHFTVKHMTCGQSGSRNKRGRAKYHNVSLESLHNVKK